MQALSQALWLSPCSLSLSLPLSLRLSRSAALSETVTQRAAGPPGRPTARFSFSAHNKPLFHPPARGRDIGHIESESAIDFFPFISFIR